MKGFKKYLDKTFNIALILAMVLLVVMVVIVFLNVVFRYGFNSDPMVGGSVSCHRDLVHLHRHGARG